MGVHTFFNIFWLAVGELMNQTVMDEGFAVFESVVGVQIWERVDVCVCEVVMTRVAGHLGVEVFGHRLILNIIYLSLKIMPNIST